MTTETAPARPSSGPGAPTPAGGGQSPRAHGQYPALDGLRIVAVTAVMGTHAAFWTGHYTQGTGRDILSHLDIGVAVFFVISGFLISREWLSVDRRTGGSPRLRGYAVRRLRRIMPAYWVALAVVILAFPANHTLGVVDVGRDVLLLQTYGFGHLPDAFTQSWSLCAEAAFYATLPLVAWLVVRVARRRERVPVVAAGAAVLGVVAGSAWIAYYHGQHAPWLLSAGYWLPTNLAFFAAGLGLCAVRLGTDGLERAGTGTSRGARAWRSVDRLGDSPGVCVVLGLSAFAVAITPVTGSVLDPLPPSGQALARSLLYMLAALALVLPAVLGRGGVYDTVLGNPVMRYLGRISYSVFLFHLMVLQGVQHVLGHSLFQGSTLQTWGLTWVITIPIAALVYRVIERPALRLGSGRRPRVSS